MAHLRFPRLEPASFGVLGLLLLVGVTAVTGASGCGNSSSASPGAKDGGLKKDSGVPIIGDDDDDDDDDGGQNGDAGPLGDDDDDGGGDSGLLGPSYGAVQLAQTATSASAYSYTLTVGFSTTASSGNSCTTRVLTPSCVLITCTGRAGGGGTPVSAGVVTVQDGDGGLGATATPTGSSYPAPAAMTGELFMPGDLLTATAAGAVGGIAGFSAQAIGPNEIQVTTPSSLASVSAPRSQPLTVGWGNGFDGSGTAGESTKVAVTVATSNAGTTKSVVCSFSAAEGSGAVPLSGSDGTYVDQAGTGGVTGTISLTPTSTTEVVAGTRAVTFTVTAGAHGGTFVASD